MRFMMRHKPKNKKLMIDLPPVHCGWIPLTHESVTTGRN